MTFNLKFEQSKLTSVSTNKIRLFSKYKWKCEYNIVTKEFKHELRYNSPE